MDVRLKVSRGERASVEAVVVRGMVSGTSFS